MADESESADLSINDIDRKCCWHFVVPVNLHCVAAL